jgi:hypothetical protein
MFIGKRTKQLIISPGARQAMHWAIVAIVLIFPLIASAQTSGTGSIQGTITDPTGALVEGAKVMATNAQTGVISEATTTGTGRFVLPLLSPGSYTVTITATNFAAVTERDVVVDALAAVAVNVQLSLTATTEAVTVTGEQAALQTEDLKLGSSINNETYDSLPLVQNKAARDPSAFIGLAVGVNSFSTQPAGPSTASFNGGQTYQNETYLEGLPMTSAGTSSDTRNLAFGVSVEAVEQFQVAVTGSEATYEGQGVSNFIVKSGANKFHGSAYEFFRNTVLDAKPFFSTGRPPDHQNEFGGNFSGPILKDKLFFFLNYDGYRYSSVTLPIPQNIPTLAERNGDFSAAGFQPIYDPNACLATNSSGACISRQQFSYNGVLNVIPPSRLSAAAKSFQSYLPQPINSAISANYTSSLPDRVSNDSGTAKVDYTFSPKHRVFGIFSRGKYANPLTGSLAAGTLTTQSALPVPYPASRNVLETSTLAQVHYDWIIRPDIVNDFGYGFNRLFIPLVSNTADGNYPQKAGLTGLPPGIASTAFPDINFAGNNIPVSWDGTNSHVNTEAQSSFTAQDNLIWTKGRHSFTIGYQWQALQDNFNNPLTGTLAVFNFAPDQTSNFNGTGSNAAALNTVTGNAYASYLVGAVSSSSVTYNSVIETGGRYKTHAGYFQDNIKLNPGLTINFGLRYDVWEPFKEVQDRQTFFDPNLVNPVAGNRLGALNFSGYGSGHCNCRTPVNVHFRNFGPRIGFAQKVGNNTVVRGAYGIFYAHAGAVGGRVNGRQGLSQIGFNNSGSATSTVTGQPAYFWDNGVPGNVLTPPFFNPSYGIGFISASAPGAAAIGAGPGTAQTLSYADRLRDGQPPEYQNFFLNVQRSFGANTTMSVAYSGSVGRYLPGAGVADQYTNQIPVQYLPLGSLLTQTLNSTTQAQAAALGFTVTTPFPNFSGTVGQALKPYPQYSSISNPWRDVGKSSYNSLQVTFNRRSANGLTYMVNYTYAKEMDDLAGLRQPGALYLEYTVGALYRRHVVQSTVVYQLPFGNGRRFNPGNSIVSTLVSNFQVSGIFTGASGAPVSVTGTCTGGGIIDASCYPNLNPSFTGPVTTNNAKPHTQAEAATSHIASAAFANPAPYTYGNAARNAPYGLFAPHTTNIDASVRREIPIHESVRLLFQADVFNLPNRTYFAAPNTTLGSSGFGTFSNQANQSRKFQFSGRISF